MVIENNLWGVEKENIYHRETTVVKLIFILPIYNFQLLKLEAISYIIEHISAWNS